MPKIIENIREKLLEEAKRQVMEEGYSSMTIRSVAKACSVGVGTVYNYFSSKEMLVAGFMLEDWMQCKEAFEKGCNTATEPRTALESIYLELHKFMEKYDTLFSDESAENSFARSFQQRHTMLRRQIAEPLLTWAKKKNSSNPEFLAEFLAESMLTWILAGTDFEQIAEILLQLL